MPTYQYRCTACDHAFEQVQSFSDDALTVCPACEGRLRKVFNSVGVVFKGSGFYKTDSRPDSATSTSTSGNGKDAAASSSSDSSSSATSGSGASNSSTGSGSSSSSGSSGSSSSSSSTPATTSA